MRHILGYISAAGAGSVLLFAYRWFLLKTEVMIGYNWSWQGTDFHPNFDVRNLSSSRTYVIGDIAYTRDNGKEIIAFDNKSLWGHELRPGTIAHLEAAPVPQVNSLADCVKVEITLRLQNGREFRAQGPGQLYTGLRKYAFALRQRIEKSSLPLPG